MDERTCVSASADTGLCVEAFAGSPAARHAEDGKETSDHEDFRDRQRDSESEGPSGLLHFGGGDRVRGAPAHGRKKRRRAAGEVRRSIAGGHVRTGLRAQGRAQREDIPRNEGSRYYFQPADHGDTFGYG